MDVLIQWVVEHPQNIPVYLIVSAWAIQNMLLPFVRTLNKQQVTTQTVVDASRESEARHDEAINRLLDLLGRNLVGLGDNLTALRDINVRQMNVLDEVRDTTSAHRREFNDAGLVRRIHSLEAELEKMNSIQQKTQQLLVATIRYLQKEKLK